MLRLAFQSINHNARIYLLFLAIDLPVTVATLLFNEYYITPREEALGERAVGLLYTIEGVIQIAFYALAATLVFTRLAGELDKPLWKIGGDRDALGRFYTFWLLMGIVYLGIMRFGMMFAQRGDESLAGGLLVLGQFVVILVIPAGATVTFIGNARGEDVRAALAVAGRIVDRIFLAMLIGFFQVNIVAGLMLLPNIPLYMKPVLSAIDVYVDCVVFAYVFLACREQRDLEDQQDPYDDL